MTTPSTDRERRRSRRPRRAAYARSAGTASARVPWRLTTALPSPPLVALQLPGRPLHRLLGGHSPRGDLAHHRRQQPLVVDLHAELLLGGPAGHDELLVRSEEH